MELRHLQAFAAAAERESFTRAAESLKVTQAAVSQQVAALEEELSTALFERRGRGVRLTGQGRQLYGFARQILDLVQEARCQIGESAGEVSGELAIASSTVPAEWLLPELLAEFRARFPQVRESLVVSDSRLATAAVEAGEADVGFVGEPPRSSRLEAHPVAEDELMLFAAADHPLAGKGTATLKQLCRLPLIVREPGSASRGCVEQALQDRHVPLDELNIIMEVNSNDAIRAAVERGVGVAFLSERANRQQAGLAAVKVRGFRPRRQLYVIHNARRLPAAAARQFLAFLQQWRPSRGSKKK